MKKLLTLLLAVVMLMSMAACAPEQAAGTPDDPVTITLYPINANLQSGTVDGWLGEYLLSKGIILEIWPYSDEKFTAMTTSGQLPDILYVPSKADTKALSESNLLLDLSSYMDRMPHIKENAEIQNAIAYAKEYVSAGRTNMIPLRIGEATETIDTERAAVKLYWEAYETIGCPAINTWDDLIDVLKQMKEVYPKNELGDETYGARLFANDGSYFYSIYNWYVVNGIDVSELPYFVEANAATESFKYILDDDSQYKAGLKFFNKMFREGLVDPDSMTSTRAQQQANVTAGAALAGWAGAPGWEQYGYYPVYIGESVSIRNETGYPFGNSGYLAVSAATENVEACLKLLDMFANPDDLITISCGPKGQLWDVDANGKGYVTDKGYRYWTHGDTVKINGEDFELFNTQYFLNTGAMTSYDIPWSVGGCWELVEYNASTDLMESWKKTYPGYSGFREMLLEKDQFENAPFFANASQFAAATDDAQKLVMNAAKSEIVTASWKMIYAKTDAEFEQIWDAAVAKCEEAGIKAIYDWRVAEMQKAINTRDNFLKG